MTHILLSTELLLEIKACCVCNWVESGHSAIHHLLKIYLFFVTCCCCCCCCCRPPYYKSTASRTTRGERLWETLFFSFFFFCDVFNLEWLINERADGITKWVQQELASLWGWSWHSSEDFEEGYCGWWVGVFFCSGMQYGSRCIDGEYILLGVVETLQQTEILREARYQRPRLQTFHWQLARDSGAT